jgi:hypothetical protein
VHRPRAGQGDGMSEVDPQELLGRAVHELAHAVAAHRLGYAIDHVQLEPPKVVFPSEAWSLRPSSPSGTSFVWPRC